MSNKKNTSPFYVLLIQFNSSYLIILKVHQLQVDIELGKIKIKFPP
jgi:hypothetical protein